MEPWPSLIKAFSANNGLMMIFGLAWPTFKQTEQFHGLSTIAKAPACIAQENSSYLTKLKPTAPV